MLLSLKNSYNVLFSSDIVFQQCHCLCPQQQDHNPSLFVGANFIGPSIMKSSFHCGVVEWIELNNRVMDLVLACAT